MTENTNRAASAALYRAVWRWHFIAGLVVLPFVLIQVAGLVLLFFFPGIVTIVPDLMPN